MLSAMVVSAQKTGPRYVKPQDTDDDSDLSSDLLAGACCHGNYWL